MNKLTDTSQQVVSEYGVSHPDLETGPRFIVPVTDPEADLTVVTRRVWELANATGNRVRFLGLCDDARLEPGMRRALATMSAMVNYGKVASEWEIVSSRNWVEGVSRHVRAGDAIICWQGQHSKLLQADLDVPIYFIPEVHQEHEPRSSFPARAAAWLGSVAIIIFFFLLQVEIGHMAKGWVAILQVLSVIGEFGLIFRWNNLFR